MHFSARALMTAALIAFAAPSAAHAQAAPANPVDAVMSPNVEYLGSLKADLGMTTGARIVRVGDKDRLFVTSGKNLSIYDITGPNVSNPQLLGILPNVAWENEEVATNGKVLVFTSDFYSFAPNCLRGPLDGCIQIFDVRDPANPKALFAVPGSTHSADCALDCKYIYADTGAIIDASGVLDNKEPKVIGDWVKELKPQGVNEQNCHHVREIRPGWLLTACQPFAVFTINESEGGTPGKPKLLYKGKASKFVHSARWPRQGTDKFVLVGGEQNFTGRCELNNSEFSTYSAEKVLAKESDEFEGPLAQIVPAGNGVYADGKPVAGALGCSVHWFQEQPSFRDGGLVALSEYEDGVRFEQIKPDGSIVEQGFFLGAGSSSSSPKWAPDGKTVYSIDYQRGVDILRWNGDTYVPNAAGVVTPRKGAVRGTNGSAAALRAMRRLRRVAPSAALRKLRAQGWVPR